MRCRVEGVFIENSKIKKKDGTDLLCSFVLVGHEVVQINNHVFNENNTKKYQPVSLEVDVRSTEYGLMVSVPR